ncbi:hypothetical protein CRG98_032101 [Punica granatum]|uniref:Mitochondrial import receptor subunit TOM6 homolog n=1 Tax=Punica granatum TaxID=22663 RepID=A0A2I0IU50_PUNGR|nr:hypothetical protein CRG98_032101 [Punica granatum]
MGSIEPTEFFQNAQKLIPSTSCLKPLDLLSYPHRNLNIRTLQPSYSDRARKEKPATLSWGKKKKKKKRRPKQGIMFPGMFMRKPDKAEALKQLRTHVTMFGVWVAVIRVTPYVLHYFSDEKEELKLDF